MANYRSVVRIKALTKIFKSFPIHLRCEHSKARIKASATSKQHLNASAPLNIGQLITIALLKQLISTNLKLSLNTEMWSRRTLQSSAKSYQISNQSSIKESPTYKMTLYKFIKMEVLAKCISPSTQQQYNYSIRLNRQLHKSGRIEAKNTQS